MFLSSPSQIELFAIFFVLGFSFGAIHSFALFFLSKMQLKVLKGKHKQTLLILFDFLLGMAFFVAFVVFACKVNFGIIRAYEWFSVLLGFIGCRMFAANYLAKLQKKWYDFFVKKFSKVKK